MGIGLLLAIQWSWPVLGYRLLTRSYRLPLLGRVWRHSDRIWLLLSQKKQALALPAEVLRRTRNHPADGESAYGESDRQALLQREFDLFEASVKRYPLYKLAVLAWGLLLGFLILSMFLPLYQLIGNTRGW